jgi:hypothetical protein
MIFQVEGSYGTLQDAVNACAVRPGGHPVGNFETDNTCGGDVIPNGVVSPLGCTEGDLLECWSTLGLYDMIVIGNTGSGCSKDGKHFLKTMEGWVETAVGMLICAVNGK